MTLAWVSAIWARVRAWAGPVLGALAAIGLYLAGRRAGRRDERGEKAERAIETRAEIDQADARADARHVDRVDVAITRIGAEPADEHTDIGEAFARARAARERALREHGR